MRPTWFQHRLRVDVAWKVDKSRSCGRSRFWCAKVVLEHHASLKCGWPCYSVAGQATPDKDQPLATDLFAFPIRKFLECFPGQPAHARLQVGDGDAFGAFQIVERVEDLLGRIASDGGSSRNLDRESCLCLHFSPLYRGHSTLGTG
jgi:hypothetical protein